MSTDRPIASALLAILSCCGSAVLAASVPADTPVTTEAPERPLDVDLEETIEVRMVLVDLTVIDRKGRTVPDLTPADFDVIAGGRHVEIASLDADCPLGVADDPVVGEDPLVPDATHRAGFDPRFVLVFDYFHIPRPPEVLDTALEIVERLAVDGHEHMVMSLGGNGLRVQTPFTDDLGTLRETLQAMQNDPALWAGNHARLTELRFFDRMRTLLTLLETVPGRKIVILFSGSFIPDGFFYDTILKELSALAARARTAIYTVDSEGMRTLEQPDSGIGGPLMLRRLANETGGRPTANTNDLSVGYARALRDSGCTYTLGFMDRSPRPNRNRKLVIKMIPPGMRAIHPTGYVVRTKKKKRRELVHTAQAVPEMFESDAVGLDTFLVRPRSARRWEAVLAVHPRPGLPGPAAAEWDLKGVVRLPSGSPIHTFQRTVRFDTDAGGDTGSSRGVHFESIRAAPGRYRVSAVLSRGDLDQPLAATIDIELPDLPRKAPFLVGPLLGRPVDELELYGRPASGRLDLRVPVEPLVAGGAASGEALASMTWLCWIGPDDGVPGGDLHRVLRSRSERTVRAFDPQPVDLTWGRRLRCDAFLDSLPVPLAPGEYEMLAISQVGEGAGVARKTSFRVVPAR